MMLRSCVSLLVLAIGPGIAAADDAPPAAPGAATALEDGAVAEMPIIEAAEAADHVGEECVVEMVVRAARMFDDGGRCFLNSHKNHRDEDNFTVVIFRGGLARFREADIDDPADHFLDRTIRVRGVIAEHKDRPQIVVEDPEQIELVEKPAAAEADAE